MENMSQKGVWKVYLVCVLGMVVGSFISPLIKLIIQTGVDSSVITFYRLLFVSILVLPILFSREENRAKVRAMSKKTWLLVIGYSMCKTFALIAWAESLNQGTSSFICNTLGNCSTIFVVLLSWIFLKEKTSPKALVGVGICLAGVFVIGADQLSGGLQGTFLGIVFIMASAFLNGSNQTFARAVRQGLDLLPPLGVDYCLGTIITGSYGLMTGADFSLNPTAILYMIILSWGCTLFCHSAPIWAMKYINAVTASVINLAGPFITAIVAFFLLGEVPSKMTYVGAAIMIVGLAYYVIVEQKENQKEAAQKQPEVVYKKEQAN